jgi:MFS family permease
MKRELKLLLVVSALFTLAAELFGPIYAVFVEQIGGDLLTAGGAYAAFAIATGVLIFFIGKWEDRVMHLEKLVVVSYLLNVVGFIGYLMIRNPIDLFIVQIVFGIATAVNTPAFDGLYSKLLDKGKYASEWGMWESQYYIIGAIAAASGGFLAQMYGFKFLFTVMLIVSILGFLASTLLLRRK